MADLHVYDRPILRALDVDRLAKLTQREAGTGELNGLEGNQQYRDIRGCTWDFLAETIIREKALFERFAQAADVEKAADDYADEIADAEFPEEDFWGLDIGVIAAVVALSALDLVSFSSCNAGGFGGQHVEPYPHVGFFLRKELALKVLAIAEEADVGLEMMEGGRVQIYGRTDYDLHRFAETALMHHLKR